MDFGTVIIFLYIIIALIIYGVICITLITFWWFNKKIYHDYVIKSLKGDTDGAKHKNQA